MGGHVIIKDVKWKPPQYKRRPILIGSQEEHCKMLMCNPTSNFMYKPAQDEILLKKDNNRYAKGTIQDLKDAEGSLESNKKLNPE